MEIMPTRLGIMMRRDCLFPGKIASENEQGIGHRSDALFYGVILSKSI